MSKCSPHVYDILTSKASMNSPLLDLYKDKGVVAYDVNKQYTNILMNCDNYGCRCICRLMKLGYMMELLILEDNI